MINLDDLNKISQGAPDTKIMVVRKWLREVHAVITNLMEENRRLKARLREFEDAESSAFNDMSKSKDWRHNGMFQKIFGDGAPF